MPVFVSVQKIGKAEHTVTHGCLADRHKQVQGNGFKHCLRAGRKELCTQAPQASAPWVQVHRCSFITHCVDFVLQTCYIPQDQGF